MTAPTRTRVADATARLAAAGVESPRVDAELLAAHVLGIPRTRLVLAPDLDDDAVARLDALVARRATREPLQHLLSSAVLGPVSVAVGPGVFVPRPETELLLGEAVSALRGIGAPRVVDLCTGSGALALAIATARPDAEVHAVELDPGALAWARRNLEGSGVLLTAADVTDPATLATLEDSVDVVVANPPYVETLEDVQQELTWEPDVALLGSGEHERLARAAKAAFVVFEVGDGQAQEVAEMLERLGCSEVAVTADLTGRARVVEGRLP